MKKKSENVKNLEEDVKKIFKVMLDEYEIQPSQKVINLVIQSMVDKSRQCDVEKLMYSDGQIRYEIRKMIRDAFNQKFGG